MLELMIVVAILGIIGALATPMFTGTVTTRLRAAAIALASDLDAARAESMAHGEDLRYLVINPSTNTYYIAPESDTSAPITHVDSGQPYTRTFGTGEFTQLGSVRISAYALDKSGETNDSKLGFGLYGQTDQATDATITLASSDSQITLTINATTGEVTIGSIY